MKIKIQTIIVEIGLVISILLTTIFGLMFYLFSFELSGANSTAAHMRVPVLLMGLGFLACLLAALIIAFLLMERIRKNNAFEARSVRLLRAIGTCALAAILPLVALFFYTRANVAGSITNIYIFLGIFVMVIASTFFFLIAALFQKAVDYKQKVELTV